MDSFEKFEKMNRLAHDILILSRNTLLVNLRFLDAALSQFDYFPINKSTFMTTGKTILYNPEHVLKSYKSAKEIPVRDYLHILMHCIFRHMYANPSLNRLYWDFACDIAVENAITELNLKAVSTFKDPMQAEYISKLKQEIKHLTAEKIYHYLCQHNPDQVETARLRGLFYADNHEIWYMTAMEISVKYGLSSDSQGEENGYESQGTSNGIDDDKINNQDQQYMSMRSKMDAIWQNISERMQVDLDTFGKQHGILPGAMTQNLAAVNREKYDYTAFLKKFAVMGEVMKVNDDEFDYIFYTYGLKLYDKMPLVEPLEYKEIKAIKEFVIAIDTSGSTSGELVQKFVQKTYNILKSTESFFTKINLHIIQCDAEIQEDAKITCQTEFDEYLKNMQIRGLGGTDFRPVFEYVEQLRQSKEFTNLKGLIYFTDGCGEFPERKPDYDTAFVFVDDEYNNPDVPVWAIKLVLQKDEI